MTPEKELSLTVFNCPVCAKPVIEGGEASYSVFYELGEWEGSRYEDEGDMPIDVCPHCHTHFSIKEYGAGHLVSAEKLAVGLSFLMDGLYDQYADMDTTDQLLDDLPGLLVGMPDTEFRLFLLEHVVRLTESTLRDNLAAAPDKVRHFYGQLAEVLFINAPLKASSIANLVNHAFALYPIK